MEVLVDTGIFCPLLPDGLSQNIKWRKFLENSIMGRQRSEESYRRTGLHQSGYESRDDVLQFQKQSVRLHRVVLC